MNRTQLTKRVIVMSGKVSSATSLWSILQERITYKLQKHHWHQSFWHLLEFRTLGILNHHYETFSMKALLKPKDLASSWVCRLLEPKLIILVLWTSVHFEILFKKSLNTSWLGEAQLMPNLRPFVESKSSQIMQKQQSS